LLGALRLDRHEEPELPAGDNSWQAALSFADRTQLTLPWRSRLAASSLWDHVPAATRSRLDANLAGNTERLARLKQAFAEIAGRLDEAGVDFLVLKGLSHGADFAPDPRLRVQYDIDLFCLRDAAGRARDALLDLGYEPHHPMDGFPLDHLPAMVRKTGWRWRGDYFDPEIPPSVDVHFRFWDPETERLPAPGTAQFWNRRVGSEIAGRHVYQMDLVDQLGYAGLHAVRHLLRGSLRLYHVYEIACFLECRRDDAALWRRWLELHSPALRMLETIAFRLAQKYFGAPLPAAAGSLPDGAERWLGSYAWSPVEAHFRPNKRELLLHLSLLETRADRWSVARRRLAPLRLPPPFQGSYGSFVLSRLVHHARLLAPTLWELARWR